ncbi:MAG: protoporphyrinogen oxidase [Thermodesulfovibrionales bacterium]|nr:protoporphyrinogen oxidase [Thermodesulfovibrionales bacterium]
MDRIVIVGGGISGLSLSYALLESDPSADVVVFESEKRPGGKIWTEKVNGFLCEGGVNGFLDNRAKTLELASKLLINPLRSSDAARKRYVFSGGKLRLLPESPLSFLSSDLLSLYGRLRVMYEFFAPRGSSDDETLADFARRRLGKEAYEKLIDPMASGIYAGNPELLSLKSCFTKIFKLEEKYGSLIKGMIKLQRAREKERRTDKLQTLYESDRPNSPASLREAGRAKLQTKVSAGPGGTLTSFHNGMGMIIDSLKSYLEERLRVGGKVISVERKGKRYAVHLSDGMIVEAEIVVIASPAYSAAEILKNLDRHLSSVLSEIQYPSVSVVCFGYRKERIANKLDGFGFLIPYKERRKILGALWDSSIFPGRAPDGYVLLRSMVGGARASEIAMQDDSRLIDVVAEELKDIMDIKAQPDFVKIYRHEKAIPQYNIGHDRKLKTVDEMLLKYKNLYLTGNAYRGIGVNDCIENSYKLAETIIRKEEI